MVCGGRERRWKVLQWLLLPKEEVCRCYWWSRGPIVAADCWGRPVAASGLSLGGEEILVATIDGVKKLLLLEKKKECKGYCYTAADCQWRGFSITRILSPFVISLIPFSLYFFFFLFFFQFFVLPSPLLLSPLPFYSPLNFFIPYFSLSPPFIDSMCTLQDMGLFCREWCVVVQKMVHCK